MKKVLRILLVLSYSAIAPGLIAQETKKYNLNQNPLVFRDGVYTNIDMVKQNSPISSTWIVTDMEVDDRNFYRNITRADEIVFFDDNGVRTVLDTKRIWGYCCDGDLHINVGGAFHKIEFAGRVSYFRALKTTSYPNPFMGSYHTGSFWATQPIFVTKKNAEYLVDIVDNKVWKFDSEGLERVLKEDSQLWNKFEILTKREKEYMRYIFLRMYNEKYPLDIPFD